jgi:hypothetical protein
MAETARAHGWRGATRLRRRILPSIIEQLFQFHVEAFADAQAVTGAALKQCAGLIGSLCFDAPFLKARDLHGGVEHLRRTTESLPAVRHGVHAKVVRLRSEQYCSNQYGNSLCQYCVRFHAWTRPANTDGGRADLSPPAGLSDRYLTDLVIGHCDFSGANLGRVILTRFDPQNVNFDNTDFSGAMNYEYAYWEHSVGLLARGHLQCDLHAILGYESGRLAIEDLIEFEPTASENIISILITELKCYSFLLKSFEHDELRNARFELRGESYTREVPELCKKVNLLYGHNDEDWIWARRTAQELARRYQETFGTWPPPYPLDAA